MNFIIWLIVGGLIGWVASMIMKTDGQQGVILNVVVGIVGAMLGGWFLVLRFHQAVARAWPEVGPALGVPVLVGQHGTGPWQVSVFQPDEPHSTVSSRKGWPWSRTRTSD